MSTGDPMATVRRYIDAFNKGGSILDGMAPHVWHGPTAAEDWYRDVLAEGKRHGASDYVVTVSEPLHNAISGDSAYVVVHATMTFKLQGKEITQSGAVFTVAFAILPKDGGSPPGPGPKGIRQRMRSVDRGDRRRRMTAALFDRSKGELKQLAETNLHA